MSRQEAPARPDSLRAVLGAAVLFFSVLLVFASVKSHRDLVAARDHRRDLERTIRETRERNEVLRGRIERLRRDPDTLEGLAREQLGMVRPNDLVIVLPQPVPATAPSTAPATAPARPLAVPVRLTAPTAPAVPSAPPAAAPAPSTAPAAPSRPLPAAPHPAPAAPH
jgi:cell division protein FtsB